MSNTPTNAKEVMQANLILTASLMIGVIMMLTVIHFVMPPNTPSSEGNNTFLIIAAVIALGGIFIGQKVFEQRVSAIQDGTVFEKLSAYRPALIIKYAMLEAPAMIAVIFYFLEGHIYFVIIALFLVLIMAYHLPLKSRVTNDLNLNAQEQKHLG